MDAGKTLDEIFPSPLAGEQYLLCDGAGSVVYACGEGYTKGERLAQPSLMAVLENDSLRHAEVASLERHKFLISCVNMENGFYLVHFLPFPVTSEKADRVAMFVNLLQKNTAMANLFAYGVEGTDYELTDGKVSKTNTEELFYEWMIYNVKISSPTQAYTDEFMEVYRTWDDKALPSLSFGFSIDYSAGDVHNCSMKNLMLPDFFVQSSVPVAYPETRNYFENCYISGGVDFIFVSNTVYFDQCEIHSRKRQGEDKALVTAASTPAGQEYGFVFSHCRLTGDSQEHSVYLRRPWRDYAKTAFVHCHMDIHICPEGWHNWGKARAETLCSYVEYRNLDPGAATHARAPFCRQLDNPELETYYSRETILRGSDKWGENIQKR